MSPHQQPMRSISAAAAATALASSTLNSMMRHLVQNDSSQHAPRTTCAHVAQTPCRQPAHRTRVARPHAQRLEAAHANASYGAVLSSGTQRFGAMPPFYVGRGVTPPE